MIMNKNPPKPNEKANPCVAPKVKTDLNSLIDEIQTHNNNISVKKDGRHLVIKATLKGDE